MGPSSTGGIYRTILGIFRPKFASILRRSIASTTKSFAKTGNRPLLLVVQTTRRSLGSLRRVLCATPFSRQKSSIRSFLPLKNKECSSARVLIVIIIMRKRHRQHFTTRCWWWWEPSSVLFRLAFFFIYTSLGCLTEGEKDPWWEYRCVYLQTKVHSRLIARV